MLRAALVTAALLLAGCGAAVEVPPPADLPKLVSVPLSILAECRAQGARVYDKCTDQRELFTAAKNLAAEQDKVILVSYGADWCIWCHVLDKYLQGYSGAFDYEFGAPGSDETATATLKEKAVDKALAESQARALAEFTANNFILFHLESDDAPGSDEILQQTGAIDAFDSALPFVFTLTEGGEFAAAMPEIAFGPC